jgi:hypothetical protein
VIGLDFADPSTGLSGVLRDERSSALFDHAEVVGVDPAGGAELELTGDRLEVSLALPDAEAELEASIVGSPAELSAESLGTRRLSICRVGGELRRGAQAVAISCLGVLTQADPDPSRFELRRSLAVALADGGLLALEAARPSGARDHGAEIVTATLTAAEGEPVEIAEALLSTEYDAAGRHRRAGLELWPEGEDVLPLRAAGSLVCGTGIPLPEGQLDLAFMRWSSGGRPGLGRYEIARGG